VTELLFVLRLLLLYSVPTGSYLSVFARLELDRVFYDSSPAL